MSLISVIFPIKEPQLISTSLTFLIIHSSRLQFRRVLQRNISHRVCICLQEEIYFKELLHVAMEACRVPHLTDLGQEQILVEED